MNNMLLINKYLSFFFFYLQTYRIRTLSILLSVHVFKLLSQKTPNYLSIILLYTIKQKIGYIKKFLFLIIIVINRALNICPTFCFWSPVLKDHFTLPQRSHLNTVLLRIFHLGHTQKYVCLRSPDLP
jgi:hypothetical protein